MAALKLERHGAGWRYTKRVPKALQSHYPDQIQRFTTQESDVKAACALTFRWLADLEEEFERLRRTGSRFKQVISADEVAHLVALMVHSSLSADEESREVGDEVPSVFRLPKGEFHATSFS